ncbi:MAG: energy-coupled thiamine transporter ThiT [Lachnospiraceae bacterium]|nr:energy-coupled thiamine transporter ThiT [Lachnospiraceae bacterium]
MSQTTQGSNALKLTEAAIMLALGTVLSLIKLLDLPYGGSVTVASMLPVIIIAYRHGIRFGLLTGFVFGVLQQLLGLNTLSYVTTWQSIVAVILLDYIIAFMVLGLGGAFRKMSSQAGALVLGSVFVCLLRYICHVISGATVWAGLSIPTTAALAYSLGYNATYIVPETIVTAVMAYYVGSMLDFRSASITRLVKTKETSVSILQWVGGLLVAVALIFDVRMIFAQLQNADTGEFDVTGFVNVNWAVIALISGAAIAIAVFMFIVSMKREKVRITD